MTEEKLITWDWFEIVEPKVNRNKLKRPTKYAWSIYRDEKSMGHLTRGGVGLVGQLRGQGRKKKKKHSKWSPSR
mgnify:CR=1 FL=1